MSPQNFGTIYMLDCAKIEAWQKAPISGAKLVEELLSAETTLMIGSICLGTLERVVREGAVVRIYVKHDRAISLGSFAFEEETDDVAGA